MNVVSRSAGVGISVEARSARWMAFARECCAGQEQTALAQGPCVSVVIDDHASISVADLTPLTRGAWTDGSSVVLVNACASGVDLRITPEGSTLHVLACPRPSLSTRALALAAPSRSVLLWRAALVQYPALWWSGVLGASPLHVSALSMFGAGIVLAGPGGVGKSTLLRGAVEDGAEPLSDNVCTLSGRTVKGLLEPLRSDTGRGRHMPHGRRESTWARLLPSLDVDTVIVVRRGTGSVVVFEPLAVDDVARVLAAGTYAAGELRRYWAYAATLALGTGMGPAHPDIVASASELASTVQRLQLTLPAQEGTRLQDVLSRVVLHGSDRNSERR